MSKSLSKMEYLGGHSARKGVIGILAFPEQYSSDIEFTIFYTCLLPDEWGQKQFKFDIASLTYLKTDDEHKSWWLVGKRGEVVSFDGGEPVINRIETAGTDKDQFGYLGQIRAIDGELFICGYRRQVYQKIGDSWELISKSILDNRATGPWTGFEAIDGFAKNDIYAVGDNGEIWCYDGKDWKQCKSPTKQNLADVRCIDGKVWVCGDGVILCGDKNGFDIISKETNLSENWWSIEGFGGNIYVSGNDFLGVIKDKMVAEVDTGLKRKMTTINLHSKDGVLWSIGEKDILSFDGKKWSEYMVPENSEI